ncbi:hypothetical protein INT47_002995 [Mucor saturninus]|uniref:Uncharacterized protein n=1 Tax=Mucor saturninus TaxID=64648 RepID=A0A8H7QUE8_9FUNG|nr:hypothetical protein INT47_002995 [Mucor saturninus]
MDQYMEEDVGTLDEEILDVATMQDDIVEDTEKNEYTAEDFEIVDEEAGGSTLEDSHTEKYLTSIQNRLKGGVTPPEYQRKTYWVEVEYEGFDYDIRTKPDLFYRPRVFIWLPDLLTGKKPNGLSKVHLKCPECKTANLERKEFVKKAKARRIIDQFE